MANVQDVKWLGQNIEQDDNNKLVTSAQINKWTKGNIDSTEIEDCNSIFESGNYYSVSGFANAPDLENPNNDVIPYVLAVQKFDTHVVQEFTAFNTASGSTTDMQRFVRFGYTEAGAELSTSTIIWTAWYEVGLTRCLSKDEKAAIILKDFTYEKDSSTGNYVLTGWKGTKDGEPSTEIHIPDTAEIQIEI